MYENNTSWIDLEKRLGLKANYSRLMKQPFLVLCWTYGKEYFLYRFIFYVHVFSRSTLGKVAIPRRSRCLDQVWREVV